MNKYITFTDKDKSGEVKYFILQRDFPHCVGVISQTPKENTLAFSAIPGYWLYVCFDGTLRGAFVPGYKNIVEEVSRVMHDMAQWYYTGRVLQNEKKYSKFKIGANENNPVVK